MGKPVLPAQKEKSRSSSTVPVLGGSIAKRKTKIEKRKEKKEKLLESMQIIFIHIEIEQRYLKQ